MKEVKMNTQYLYIERFIYLPYYVIVFNSSVKNSSRI